MTHSTAGDFISALLIKLVVIPAAILLPLLLLGPLMTLKSSFESLQPPIDPTEAPDENFAETESEEAIAQEAVFHQ